MSSPPATTSARQVSRAHLWLLAVLTVSVACSLLVIAVYHLRHIPWYSCYTRTGWSVVPSLFSSDYRDDSLGPMGRAYLRSQSREDGDIYGVFLEEGRKFQYPPTSLLVFRVIPSSWLDSENFVQQETYTKLAGPPQKFLRTASQLAVLATIAATVAILEIGIRRLGSGGKRNRLLEFARIGVASFLCLTFYPIAKSHELGQIQVFLNALTALGVLAHLLGWRASSGFLLGLCCLIKPQYGVLLIWGLLRRHWRFLTGFATAVIPAGLVSLAVFGWANHLRYIEVIRKIARLGETYWPNQCFNGLANRFLQNGDPVNFSAFEFAPYHPWVNAITMVTSLAILALALYLRRPVRSTDGNIDLAVIIASATLASPVAWEHHYGAFLPLFALAMPACLDIRLPARIPAIVLGTSFVAMGFAILDPEAFFPSRWWGLTASHLFFGALLLFGLLLYLRQKTAGDPTEASTAPATGS